MMRRVPPAMLCLLAGASQVAIVRGRRTTCGSWLLAAAVAAPSLALLLGSVRNFRRAGTTVDPRQGAVSDALVIDGLNAVTRNPMCGGMAGFLLAHAAARRSVVALLPAGAFVAWIHHVQLPAEETQLSEAFPEAYEAYRDSAPRWIKQGSIDACHRPAAPSGTSRTPECRFA